MRSMILKSGFRDERDQVTAGTKFKGSAAVEPDAAGQRQGTAS